MEENDGWKEHKREVLYRLDQIDGRLDRIENKLDAHSRSLAGLKVKSSIWGGATGAVVVLAEWARRTLTGG